MLMETPAPSPLLTVLPTPMELIVGAQTMPPMEIVPNANTLVCCQPSFSVSSYCWPDYDLLCTIIIINELIFREGEES